MEASKFQASGKISSKLCVYLLCIFNLYIYYKCKLLTYNTLFFLFTQRSTFIKTSHVKNKINLSKNVIEKKQNENLTSKKEQSPYMAADF